MSVSFDEFVLDNRSGLEVSVTLEAPVGSTVGTYRIGASQRQTFNPGVSQAGSARVTVEEKTHGPISQTITLEGNPYKSYLNTLESIFNVGSIHGAVKSSY